MSIYSAKFLSLNVQASPAPHLEIKVYYFVVMEMLDALQNLLDEGRGFLLAQRLLLRDILKQLSAGHTETV